MSMINITVDHCLDPEEVMRRIKEAYEAKRAKYATTITINEEVWDELTGTISASVLGVKVSGSIVCFIDKVEVTCELPLPVMWAFGRNLRTKAEYRLRNLLNDKD